MEYGLKESGFWKRKPEPVFRADPDWDRFAAAIDPHWNAAHGSGAVSTARNYLIDPAFQAAAFKAIVPRVYEEIRRSGARPGTDYDQPI